MNTSPAPVGSTSPSAIPGASARSPVPRSCAIAPFAHCRRRSEGCQVVAVDNSAAMISRCHEYLSAQDAMYQELLPVQVLEADVLSIDFAPASLVAMNFTLQFIPPEQAGGIWKIEQLTADAASDALLLDLNGDGREELCTIAPFHGDTVKIYEKKSGGFELAYTYPEKLEFLHAIFGGEVLGKPVWILGHRKGERYLLAFTYENGSYGAQMLDQGCGAANVLHYTYEGKDVLIATNREINEIARYELTE